MGFYNLNQLFIDSEKYDDITEKLLELFETNSENDVAKEEMILNQFMRFMRKEENK